MVYIQTCPLCSEKKFRLFDQRYFRNYHLSNWLCLYCGLVFMSPHMDEEELDKFYNAEYRMIYQGVEGPTQDDLDIQRARAKHLTEIALSQITDLKLHLDIGCSSGVLMEEMSAYYNCQSMGVEPSEAYRSFCIDRGLDVIRTLDEYSAQAIELFDIVTMSHVVEHLVDPVDYLSKLRSEFMHPGGYLLVEVPNLYGHNCFEIAHNFSFSSQSLVEVLHKAGFTVQLLKKHGIPRSGTRPLYLTALAQSKPVDQPPHRVRRINPLLVYWRRKIGLSSFRGQKSLSRRVVQKVRGRLNQAMK